MKGSPEGFVEADHTYEQEEQTRNNPKAFKTEEGVTKEVNPKALKTRDASDETPQNKVKPETTITPPKNKGSGHRRSQDGRREVRRAEVSQSIS